MTAIQLSTAAENDIDRLIDFLLDDDAAAAKDTLKLILETIDMLAHHPLIGREVEEKMRELVISRGRTGYLALYSFDVIDDVITVLAIRHQREGGYGDGEQT